MKSQDTKTNGRDARTPIEAGTMDQIMQSIQNVRFGEVVVTIHNGRIVQIEKREKTRFPD